MRKKKSKLEFYFPQLVEAKGEIDWKGVLVQIEERKRELRKTDDPHCIAICLALTIVVTAIEMHMI